MKISHRSPSILLFVVFEPAGFYASLRCAQKPTYPMGKAVKIHKHENLAIAHSD
jgi:hypothetical protein